MTQCLLRVALACFLLKCSLGQCDVLNIGGSADRTSIHRCLQMYEIFEEALTEDEDNLYTLREAFFSTEHPSPPLLMINYHLEWNDGSTTASIVWSRSNLFEYVNPLIFFVIEPAVVLGAFELVGATVVPRNIELSLLVNSSSIPKNVGLKEIQHALFTITARIRAYAVTQGKLPPGWDGSNNGYILHPDTDITNPLLSLTCATVMLLVFSLVLSYFVVKKVSTGIQSTEHRFYSMAVLYSIGIVTLGLNIMELMASIAFANELTKAFKNSSASLMLVITKCSFITINLLVIIVFAIYGCKKAHTFPKFSCCFCCCCTHSKTRQKLIHSVIFLSASSFFFSLVTSICPIFLLIFVYPIKMISLLLFVGALLFCTIIAIAFVLSSEMIKEQAKASSKSTSHVKSVMERYALKFVRQFLYILPVAAFVFLMFVYIRVLISIDYHTNSSSILQVISSLAPSAGLAVLGHYGRKWLNFFHDKHSQELTLAIDNDDKLPADTPQENELQLVGDDNTKGEQNDGEIELEQNDDDVETNDESANLLSEQHVVVDIEESSM